MSVFNTAWFGVQRAHLSSVGQRRLRHALHKPGSEQLEGGETQTGSPWPLTEGSVEPGFGKAADSPG